jgi:hypothetical protein
MTDEQRTALRTALKEVHDRVHELYPRDADAAESGRQALRNRLLVVDLAVHLADEVFAAAEMDTDKVVERTANLLYAVRLLAPERRFEKAAEFLLKEQNAVGE